MNSKKGQLSTMLIVSVLAALVIGGAIGWYVRSTRIPSATSQQTQTQPASVATQAEIDLHKAMRKLWEDHIIWTRAYLISAAYDNDDTAIVAQRLLRNQEDIGNAIKPYYGDEAGNRLTALLREHITTATEIVAAAKKGDQNAQNVADGKWYANAEQIANLLSSANPNWPKAQASAMMREHLDLTKQEAVDILGDNFDVGIADYDRVHEQILVMADMLSDGIVKQFPDKFGK